ncbi:MAG: isoleucine--tRNA ligase [Patescibacteria group bacterium]|nr:isoleucine--tRNA ligase [Patescibacteria group bacterium]
MTEKQPQKTQNTGPDFNRLEQEVLKFWEDNKIFEKSLESTRSGEHYIFYDGPPFATGLPHYGHILASAIKDAIPRYQTMKGKYVRRRWGWDCHGLPIENIVEQALKISGKKQIEEIGVEKFNQECRSNVLRFAEEWGKTVRRMGRWVEFENSYKTMDTTYMESVWWALQQVWNKGLIYEDRKVLLYCSRCETPISNFEVAMDNSYRDIAEESVYAKFKLEPRQRIVDFISDDKTYVLAWTTTPWTLPGNTSLNVGPNIRYVIVRQNDQHLILAKDRLMVLDGEYEIVLEFEARSIVGLKYEPLYAGVIPDPENRAHRIYSADFVTTTDGTGVVHNAAMYGEEDYLLAKEKNLPRVDMLDHKGQYLQADRIPSHLRGLFFKDADKVVLKELSEKGLVYKTQNYLHSYPHCYRCGTPLFYNALPAWFIDIQKIKKNLLKQNENINWYPEHLKEGRFAKSMETAPDWNISRNRYWATALPFWKCQRPECRHVTCVGSVAELIEKSTNFEEVYPEAADLRLKIKDLRAANSELTTYNLQLESLDLHKPFIDRVVLKCGECGGEANRVPEVVDCWVESASMPFAELHYPFENKQLFENRFPADFVAEYIGQTRAWFYVMHVMSVLLFEKEPFKNVVTTGNILAEDGSKMSKSKQNYPDPIHLIEKYGVDPLRFYLLTSPVMNADDINFSEKLVAETGRKVSLLLYNVWTFYRMYEKGKIQDSGLKLEEVSHILDKWVVSRLSETVAKVSRDMDGYNTVRAGRTITEFVGDLSTWYVRRSRERMKENGESGKGALLVLGFVLKETTKLLAPFMPFLSEHIYRDVTEGQSVHLAGWPTAGSADETLLSQMALVREMVETGLSLRKEQNLKVRQPLSELEYFMKGEKHLLPEALEAVLAEELNLKTVSGRSDFVPKAGWAFRETPVFKLALNLEITPELKDEGLARELERQVQDLRKKSGLKPGEMIDLYYNTQDDALEGILVNLFDRKKTFVSQIQKSLEVEAEFEVQSEVDGKAVWFGLVRV